MIEKMVALTLSGPTQALDAAICRCVAGRDIHLENAVSFLSAFRRLSPFTDPDPYEPRLAEIQYLMERLGIEPGQADFEGQDYTLENTDEFLQALSERLDTLESERTRLNTAEMGEGEAESILIHMESLPEQMETLADVRYIHLHLGRVPADRWEKCAADFDKEPDELLVETDRSEMWVWCIAVALPKASDKMDATLSGYGFERILPNPAYVRKMTAVEMLEGTRKARRERECLLRDVERELGEVMDRYADELLVRFSWLKFHSVCYEVRSMAGRSHNRFYLAGWVPAEQAADFEREIEAVPGFTCTLMNNLKLPEEPPVRMRGGKVAVIFMPLLKMYGLPSYGEVDPRIFMAISYTLFFGIMFGDAGQGLFLAILGFALYRKTKSWLWRVLGICGCCSILFGLVYGSCFGYEDLFPWGGFHPLESENIMTVLLLAVAVGVVILVVCMVLNIINALRKKDIRNAVFSPNGICGAVFYISLLAAVVGAYTGAFQLLRGAFLWLCIVLPLVLIWIGEPLTKLLTGQRDWRPKSIGMFLVEGFFEIFEALLGYLSNTMSFLRLGAFAISHAGMMMVVFLMSSTSAATGRVLVIILGNVFVAGLEAALASIQIIRLEFYEMFGRFNAGRGRAFAPVTVNYD